MAEVLKNNEIIESLINSLNSEIEKVGELNSIPNHIIRKNLHLKIERLKKIQKVFQIEKYNIVFIGTIGAGKTTAICHLFNLLGEFQVPEKGKNLNKTLELLSTGSGRTTICEVIIKAGEKTCIEIDPYSTEKMKKIIIDFCESLSDEREASSEKTDELSTEVQRAVRNIIDFPFKYDTVDGKQKRIDTAKEAFNTLGFNDFRDMALLNAQLEKRERTKIEFTGNAEKVWIEDTFRSINQGERKDFSIPHKIYITVSKNILSGSDLFQFNSIVDTKGIDEIIIRKDLEEYIEKEDTICLFTTAFNSAPETNIRELMKYNLQNKSRDFHQKFSVFVLPRNREPERENGCDGTWESGIEIKKGVIQDVFKNLNLEFFPENIIFFDSLRYYHNGRIDPDYGSSDIQKDKNDAIEQIKNIIERRKVLLEKEVQDIKNNFDSITDGRVLSTEEISYINESVKNLKLMRVLGNSIPNFVYDEAIEEFITYYRNHYPAWNTKHAIHRRYGTYDIRDIDIFYDAAIVCEGIDDDRVLKKFTREPKQKILDILGSLQRHEGLEILMPELIKKFEFNYGLFIQKVGNSVQEFMQDTKFFPQDGYSEFWNALISEKGKPRGPGETYTDNVCLTIRRELESDESLNSFLKTIAEKYWIELVDSTLDYFGS